MQNPQDNRNKDLLYGFDEKPPFIANILFSLQYMVPNIVSLLFPVLVMQQTTVTPLNATSVLSISMIIMAFVTFSQSRRWGKWGSGMLLPPSIAPPYLAPAMLAAKTGGLSLVFGMTLVAGIFQTLLSLVIRHLKKLIPAEVAALVLLLIGFELGLLGIQMYTELHAPFHTEGKNLLFYAASYLPILLILIFGQLLGAFFKKYGIALTVVISYALIVSLGFMNPQHIQAIKQASWFFIPHLFIGQQQISTDLIIPFVLAAVICVVKMIGSVSAIEEIQVKEWSGPDFSRQAKANFVDGIGSLLGGTFGTMGMNVSSSAVALSLSIGVTTRFIALTISLLLLLFAFIPKVGLVLLYIPHAIMAAVLIELGSALIKNSLVILAKSLHKTIVQLYIGIGFTVGLSYGIYPKIFSHLPKGIHMFLGSSIALSMLTAVVLYLFFQLMKIIRRRQIAQ